MAKVSWADRPFAPHFEKVQAELASESSPIFTQLFGDKGVASDESGALSGALVSIKSTFDVCGYGTSGGSKLLGLEPASQDAVAVQRLKASGATLVGHTNMTELAYSGLGMNPHFGTPENPLFAGCIPGGSTSGGAVSVAKGYADIALGTDTGGSLRIPAAFCGLTGFKPSQSSTPREGCLPLSFALDSVGPMAKTVAECQSAWEVLADKKALDTAPEDIEFVIPTNFGFDGIEAGIQDLFDHAVAKIQGAGFKVSYAHLDLLEHYQTLPVWHFSAVESRRFYQDKFDLESEKLDPRVRSRIKKGENVTDEVFAATEQARNELAAEYAQCFSNKVILMPTVVISPPSLSSLAQDAEYDRINLLCLRNTTVANVLDGCSISLPHRFASALGGILLTMPSGQDCELLAIASQLEQALA